MTTQTPEAFLLPLMIAALKVERRLKLDMGYGLATEAQFKASISIREAADTLALAFGLADRGLFGAVGGPAYSALWARAAASI